MSNPIHPRRRRLVRPLVLAITLAGLVAILFPAANTHAQNGQPCFDQQQVPCTPTSGPNPRQPSPEQPTSLPTKTPTATMTPSPTATATPLPSHTPTPTRTDIPSPTAFQTPATPPGGPVSWVSTIVGAFVDLFHIPPDRVPPYFPLPTRTPTPRPDLNLILSDIEVTQAIQCMGRLDCPQDSVPLYTGKATLVRAYVRISSGPSLVTGIGGALCPGDTGDAGCTDPIRPTGKITVSNISDPASIDRGDLGATLNFILPADWVAIAGTRTFTVYANYNLENAAEWNYSDNYARDTITVQPSQSLDITFLPVTNKGVKPSVDERWGLVDWLKRVYPTSAIHVWERGAPMIFELSFNLDIPGPPGCGDGWNGLLSWLEDLRGSNPRLYYGMVENSTLTTSPYSGCGYTPGPSAAGIVHTGNRWQAQVAAQEIGHNFGRHHAPGCSAGSPDTGYPEVPANLDEFGVDVGRMLLYRPSVSFDFMGYCGSEPTRWVSAYTYEALAGGLPKGVHAPAGGTMLARPASALTPNALFLVASGSLTAKAATIDHGFFRMALPAGTHDYLQPGPYTVELHDAAGHTLSSRTISSDSLSNSDPGEAGPVNLILPWVDKTASVVFFYQGKAIGRRVATRHSPEVAFVSPSGTQDWSTGGTHTLAWQGSDQDNDVLTYKLQYSMDAGQTWETMAPYMTDTSVSVDASELAGANDAQFRVLATDGFNTAEARTGAPIQVSDKPPQVHLALPADGTTIDQGASLILEGAGTDLEDGPLTGSSLAWSSDLDGSLGTGELLVTRTLSPGQHLLTLSGRDRGGHTASGSVHVTVLAAPTAAPAVAVATQGGTSAGGSWLIILCAGAAIVAVGAWIWTQARRGRSGTPRAGEVNAKRGL